MAGSYKKIDYRVRPAKSIERRMMVEIFRRLAPFGRVEDYRYVGMGSLYFSDFLLFHRALGFGSMLSIEDAKGDAEKRRFDFNVPYRHVRMKFGPSTAILSSLDYSERTVFWMDYDGVLDKSVLADAEIIATKAKPGSLLFISVNAQPPRLAKNEDDNGPKTLLDALKLQVGSEMVPAEAKAADMSGWGTSRLYRTILLNRIGEALRHANGGRPAAARMKFRQIAYFQYEDGAKMLTLGGVLYEESQDDVFDRCFFGKLPFARQHDEPFAIDPPHLTFKELRSIDAMMPLDEEDYAKLPIGKEQITRYLDVYRYFPSFVEAEV